MELVKPDVKYKDSFVEALKDGFYLGSQSPMSDDAIADIEKDLEAFLMNKVLKPYDPTPRLRDDGKYYPNAPQIPYWLIDEGKFIGKYTSLKKEAQECVRRGCKKKDIDALDDYATAYHLYSKIEKLIDRELPVQIMHNTRKNSRTSTIIGWGLSILISVTIGKLANTYWGAFIEWLMTWKNA